MFAFINRYHHTDTAMRYDANGNLILDIDRGISVIHYNLLNLPDEAPCSERYIEFCDHAMTYLYNQLSLAIKNGDLNKLSR